MVVRSKVEKSLMNRRWMMLRDWGQVAIVCILIWKTSIIVNTEKGFLGLNYVFPDTTLNIALMTEVYACISWSRP